MGYYTQYELSFGLDADDSRHVFDVADKVVEEMEAFEPKCGKGWLNDVYEGNADSTKWYDHEDEMRVFSKKFPAIIFTLTGEGEEAGDLWVKYFKGGKMQECRAEITYPPYDAAELK